MEGTCDLSQTAAILFSGEKQSDESGELEQYEKEFRTVITFLPCHLYF